MAVKETACQAGSRPFHELPYLAFALSGKHRPLISETRPLDRLLRPGGALSLGRGAGAPLLTDLAVKHRGSETTLDEQVGQKSQLRKTGEQVVSAEYRFHVGPGYGSEVHARALTAFQHLQHSRWEIRQ